MRGRVRAQEVVQERAGQQEQQAGSAPGAAPWSVGGQEVFGVTAARRLEGEAVQGPEDAPAEVAAAEGPGAMLQGTAFTAPLVMLAVAAGEVGRAHAKAAQHAGAAVPAAARPRGRTCGITRASAPRPQRPVALPILPQGRGRTWPPRGGSKISSPPSVFAQVNPAC